MLRRIHVLPCMPRVRTARTQTDQRIDRERQRLELDHDLLDRFGRGQFVDGRDGENRLAFVHRLLRQRCVRPACWRLTFSPSVRARLRARQIVRRQDRLDAGHRQRGARVEARHARVRHRAEQQLRNSMPSAR